MKIEEGNKQLVKVCPPFTIYLLEQEYFACITCGFAHQVHVSASLTNFPGSWDERTVVRSSCYHFTVGLLCIGWYIVCCASL